MAAANPLNLLDCGHVGDTAGVCQFRGCGRLVCEACLSACLACGTLLCREHAVLLTSLDGEPRVYCPDDSTEHVVKKALLYLLNRKHGGG